MIGWNFSGYAHFACLSSNSRQNGHGSRKFNPSQINGEWNSFTLSRHWLLLASYHTIMRALVSIERTVNAKVNLPNHFTEHWQTQMVLHWPHLVHRWVAASLTWLPAFLIALVWRDAWYLPDCYFCCEVAVASYVLPTGRLRVSLGQHLSDRPCCRCQCVALLSFFFTFFGNAIKFETSCT